MISPQTVVRLKSSGRLGVVAPFNHLMANVHDGSTALVVLSGNTAAAEVDIDDLMVIGPENAVADVERCGGGQGKRCCIFLSPGRGTYSCQRFGPLRWTIITRQKELKAARHPSQPYPNCQLFP